MTSQYAYVKFGLLLEQVRNGCCWNRCVEKFSDFRSFCQKKVNLNIWQVANAIKSAQVAVRLTFLGFTELPRNASQALKLAELSNCRLTQVWGDVIKSCEGHKITAMAIESQINPDQQSASETLKLPKRVADALRRQAIEYGLTLQQYLQRLADGEELDEGSIDPNPVPIDPEISEVMDNLDRKFQAIDRKQASTNAKKVLDHTLDRFDEL